MGIYEYSLSAYGTREEVNLADRHFFAKKFREKVRSRERIVKSEKKPLSANIRHESAGRQSGRSKNCDARNNEDTKGKQKKKDERIAMYFCIAALRPSAAIQFFTGETFNCISCRLAEE